MSADELVYRTYHATDAGYVLPNDAVEYDRLEEQAIGFTEMMQKNPPIHAPLENPQQLVDIGCGTGHLTRQLAEKYPTAHVYGIDLSPVRTPTSQNMGFILGDVRKLIGSDPRLAYESADFVFSRLLFMGMTDWPEYVRDTVSLVRPGGWVEMQDLIFELYLHGSPCSDEWGWMKAIKSAAQQKGMDLQCGKNIARYMEEAGLEDIVVKEYRLPCGTWLAEQKPETRRIGESTGREYGRIVYYMLPKMLQGKGYTEEQLDVFRESALRDSAGRDGLETKLYVTIGRKP
ncbi:MAG: hypothetical protein L6R36_009229 [Xanthoria steineri]|nr:MAG: hypothetical protein L6R36_009229 [Xanthoria steineri]